MLVSLKPIGGEGSVNPADVTSIETVIGASHRQVNIWVRGHAGYGTYSKVVTVDEDAARRYLNDPIAYVNKAHIKAIEGVIKSIESTLEPQPPTDWLASLSDALDCLNGVRAEMVDFEFHNAL
jgi:hypothetical protein